MANGKWADPNVPHAGWQCVGMEDLGAPDATCEMCEVQAIRYVHTMQHSNYETTLMCGCICAGHMEQDAEGARQREVRFRARRAKRDNWLARQWRISQAGNEWLRSEGFVVVVFARGSGMWGAKVTDLKSHSERFSQRSYATSNEAKLAAFDAVTRLKAFRSS